MITTLPRDRRDKGDDFFFSLGDGMIKKKERAIRMAAIRHGKNPGPGDRKVPMRSAMACQRIAAPRKKTTIPLIRFM
jgi:hypothetical protein